MDRAEYHFHSLMGINTTSAFNLLTDTMKAEEVKKPSWCEKYEAQALGLGDLTPAVLIIVVAVVACAIGAYVLTTVGATFTANSAGSNVTLQGNLALAALSKWFVIIAIVVAAAIILGLLIRSFYGGVGGGGGRRV